MRFKQWLSEGLSSRQIADAFQRLGYLTKDHGSETWIACVKNGMLDTTGCSANFVGNYEATNEWLPPIGMNRISILRLNAFTLKTPSINRLPGIVDDRAEIMYCTYDGPLVQWAVSACKDVRFDGTLLTFADFNLLLGSKLRQWLYSTPDLIINRSGDVIIAEYPDEHHSNSEQSKFTDEFEFQDWLISNGWSEREDCFKKG